MTTIFLVAQHGFAARYLLHTDILKTLHASGARIVILTHGARDASMVAEFAGERVHLEPLHDDLGRVERETIHWLVSRARAYSLAGRSGSFVNRWETAYGRWHKKNPVLTRVLQALLWAAWRSRAVRLALLRIEMARYSVPVHSEAFERWRPSLVVTASVGYVKEDALVMREARKRGVPSAALVMGWDNATSKGYRGAEPDRILAWSDRMADLVADLQDFPRERVIAAGVANYDRYVRAGELPTRRELFERLGLDPDRRLILYATSAPRAWARNADVAATITAAMDDGHLADTQLVVRLHPNFFRTDTPSSLEPFEALAAHPRVHLDLPDIVPGALRIRMEADDAVRLAALITHADVLVNLFSTTTVEACLVDTPVVQVIQHAYDPPDERFTRQGRQTWEQYLHMRRVVERGAVRVARSPEQIVEHIARYLADPSLDRAERRDAAEVECGPSDGHAGERIGRTLLEMAGAERSLGISAAPPVAASR